jgi:hypothetical protein
MHENRETSEMPAENVDRRPAGEGSGHTARMYVPEESHRGIVPMNQSNKDRKPSAENEEGRPLIKENAGQPNTHPTQSGERVSQGLAGVRKVARDNKEMKFTALLHYLTVDLLRESFYSLKRKAAPGVDGVTRQEYEIGVEDRLIDQLSYALTKKKVNYILDADIRGFFDNLDQSGASVDDFAARDLMSDYYRRLLYQPVTSTCCSPFTALMY